MIKENKKSMYNKEELQLIKNMYANINLTDAEFQLLIYTSNKYQLDILTRQIWCVKFGNKPAQIYAGRDGFLSLGHRSGKFDGMKSGTKGNKKDGLIGFCEIFRNDMKHSFYIEVDFKEYTTNKNMWQSKPKTMIQKVAESQCLRRAFDIVGMYSPEEMSQYEEEMKNTPSKPKKKEEVKMMQDNQKQAIWIKAKENEMDLKALQEFSYNFTKKMDLSKLTYEEAGLVYNKLCNVEMVEETFIIEKETIEEV